MIILKKFLNSTKKPNILYAPAIRVNDIFKQSQNSGHKYIRHYHIRLYRLQWSQAKKSWLGLFKSSFKYSMIIIIIIILPSSSCGFHSRWRDSSYGCRRRSVWRGSNRRRISLESFPCRSVICISRFCCGGPSHPPRTSGRNTGRKSSLNMCIVLILIKSPFILIVDWDDRRSLVIVRMGETRYCNIENTFRTI